MRTGFEGQAWAPHGSAGSSAKGVQMAAAIAARLRRCSSFKVSFRRGLRGPSAVVERPRVTALATTLATSIDASQARL
jgi:hypothetical protein